MVIAAAATAADVEGDGAGALEVETLVAMVGGELLQAPKIRAQMTPTRMVVARKRDDVVMVGSLSLVDEGMG